MLNSMKSWMIAAICLCLISIASSSLENRTITDMRGKEIQLPANIERVVTIDNGLVEGVMTILGESDKIVGLGSKFGVSSQNFTSVTNGNYSYKNGMNPVRYLNPKLANLPLVAAESTGINYETLAGLKPDVVIIRSGSCAASWGINEESLKKNAEPIEKMGIPTVVVNAPPFYDHPNLSTISEEIRVIGQVFGKEERAKKLVDYLDNIVNMIKERTADVQEKDKPKVLALGLAPQSRSAGGAGNVRGAIIAYYIENVSNAINAYTATRYVSNSVVLSGEQVFALDPDIIILPTSSGYHPPSELYSAPYYQNLQELRAVKNRSVYALALTGSNCDASRLEYPIDLMIIAKACYPNRFNDIKINEWVLDFYSGLYGVDKETAKELRSAQWLNWTVEENF
jgi:iron complex transport system substrate-binding protein